VKQEFEVFLETDVFIRHLEGNEDSILIKCHRLFSCFTTVINAAELFSLSDNETDKANIKSSLFGTGVLGIPYKYSERAGKLMNEFKGFSLREYMIGALLLETKLPVISFSNKEAKFYEATGIKVINASAVLKLDTAKQIFNTL
jgi:predicted nucleic acid-binding protein